MKSLNFKSVYMFREQKRETSTMTVNKAGLVQLNIKSNSGSGSLRTTASTRLATTTRTSVPGFGIMAQRSAVGTGAIFNVKQYNSMSHSMLRHELNDNRVKVFNNVGGGYYMNLPSSNSSDNKFAAALMAVSTLASIAGTVIDALQSDDGAGTTNRTGSNNTTSSPAKSDSSTPSLNDMKNANDSTTLRGAIETAETDKAEMQSELNTLEGKLPSMKEASEAAKKELEALKPKVEAKQKEVEQKEKNVSDKEKVLDAAERDKTSKLNVAKDMEAAVGKAAENYTKASEALENAKATLASTPETITKTNPGGTTTTEPNPAYKQAQEAVKQAEQQKENAKKELDKAKEGHEKAVANYEKAIEAYEKSASDVQTAKDLLKTANNEYETAQKELNDLKKQESSANGKVKEYENALNDKEKLTKNIEKYDNEIKEQKERLTKLEQEEEKELNDTNNQMNSLSDKINKNNGKIDTTDGLNFMEKLRMKRNEKNSDKYDTLTDKRDKLQERVNYTKLSKMLPEYTSSSGVAFRKAEFGGETLYMVGSKKVSAEEYQQQLKEAQEQKNA